MLSVVIIEVGRTAGTKYTHCAYLASNPSIASWGSSEEFAINSLKFQIEHKTLVFANRLSAKLVDIDLDELFNELTVAEVCKS